MAPVSSRARARSKREIPAAPAWSRAPELPLAPEKIFDTRSVLAALEEDISRLTEHRDIRAKTVEHLRAAMQSGRAEIAQSFTKTPRSARATVAAYSHLMDGVVETVLIVSMRHLHRRTDQTDGARIAVLAVGGYGRAEMAPYSDVDLLFLIPWKTSGWSESLVESMLYILWDLHLKVGHATRSLRDCLRLGKADMTIRTSLLEHRLIAGDVELAAELEQRLRTDLFRGTEPEFVEAKLEERDERHKKFGQRYVLEPNIKEGKGGLRDLQTLFWIAKYVRGVRNVEDLVGDTFTREEFESFARAETFLLAVRCHMHLSAGRAIDHLTFDMQVEVADRMEYKDGFGRRAVEHFMQDYFRHATRVGELTRIVLTELEDRHVKKAPRLQKLLRRRRTTRPPFEIVGQRMRIADAGAFLEHPVNFIRIFDEALRTGSLLHPDAMRLIAANLDRIDDAVRDDPEANRVFLDMLLRRGNPERALRRMNELGVLGAFIPEFARVVAMMQFNMYHHYTVDEHTIQCISTLAQIERGELVEALPIATKIVEAGVNRRVLYVALLLHDIGKGRDEDHSVAGARVARKLAPRLGLKPAECDTVEWLVRYHLLMSDMAQKRDLSDPRTVRDFAKAVRTRRRLELMTLLTVCDIRSVGPGVWNNWKAQLLRSLHSQTEQALVRGLEDVNRETREVEARRALRDALSEWDKSDVRTELGRHYGPYWQGLPTSAHVVFAGLMRGLGNGDIRMEVERDDDRDGTRILLCDGRSPRHLQPSGGSSCPRRGERRRRALLHQPRRHRHGVLLGAGCRRPSLRAVSPAPPARHDLEDAEGRGHCPRGPGAQGQAEEAREGLLGADVDHLRQRGFRPLHDHRGRHARPARPAARPHADAGGQQRADRERRDRDLRRAGRRLLLRQGHVRPEVLRRAQAAAAREAPARGDTERRRAGTLLI